MRGTWLRTAFAATATLAALAFTASAANAESPHIYWVSPLASPSSIGNANLDGSHAQQALGSITGTQSIALAVDAQHIYWSNSAPVNNAYTISRANLDGTHVETSFIAGLADQPTGIVIAARHIYWTDGVAGTIGRANLDGSGANPSFITVAAPNQGPVSIAANDRSIYWMYSTGTIGRANLDGSDIESDIVQGASGNLSFGIAVDARHIYWAQNSTVGASPVSSVGRANLDGSGADASFITTSGLAFGVAVDAEHLYWTETSATGGNATSTIGRANLDGTGVDQQFIPTQSATLLLGNVAVLAPRATASPGALAFGTQPLATLSAPRTLTLRNDGLADLTVPLATPTGADYGDFLVSRNDCFDVPAGGSCHIDVRFGPTATGSRNATLAVSLPLRKLTIGLSGSGGELPAGPAGATGPAGPQGTPGPRGRKARRRAKLVCRPARRRRATARRRAELRRAHHRRARHRRARGHRGDRLRCRLSGHPRAVRRARKARLTRRRHTVARGTVRRARVLLRSRHHIRQGAHKLTLRVGSKRVTYAVVLVRRAQRPPRVHPVGPVIYQHQKMTGSRAR